ncbi:MAG: dephospho-CoA kinase [Bacteroidota bacterium]
MIRVGVTGGIGSGKSFVCAIFEQLGIPVYNADSRAKWLVNNDPYIRKAIIAAFGELSFTGNQYNTTYISGIVFNQPDQLALLNSIIHPVVFADWAKFYTLHADAPIVIKEAAIMLETESKNTVDQIILVYAPEDIRIKRVMERDGTSEDVIRKKLKSQMPEEDKLPLVQFVIYNDGSQSVIEQVRNIHRQLLNQ